MIVSASRRTDIPAYYAEWFFARLRARYVLAANPYNAAQARRVSLAPGEAEGFVFWTKNPAPMLENLPLLAGFPYYFHCTLTGAPRAAEPGLPSREKTVLPAVLRLAGAAGPEAVVWRFDPLVYGEGLGPEYHAEQFSLLARRLAGQVAKCVFSFYAPYAGAAKRMAALGLRAPGEAEKLATAALLAAEARRHGLRLESCCEGLDLSSFGIGKSRCVDAARLSLIAGRPVSAKRDRHQRPGCGCDASVDIGAYGSCPAGCAYCYATRGGPQAVWRRAAAHRPQSDEGLGM